jgi:RNA polymerase sigma-70 factor (ECF subfamily)
MPEVVQTEEFVRLLTENQRPLYVYILSLIGNPGDADELLQETNLVLWRKIEDFKPGTNFSGWAMRTAHFEVLAYRKRRQREQLRFAPELVDVLADEGTEWAEDFDAKRRALTTCLSRLNETDRELLRLRYGLGSTAASKSIDEIASKVGRTVQATYQVLHRIRTSLLDCMRRRLAAEERT